MQCNILTAGLILIASGAAAQPAITDFAKQSSNSVLMPQYANGSLFTATADAATNTTGDLSCFGTGIGSQTIPANAVSIGSKLHLTCKGAVTTPASNAATIAYKVKWGAATILSATSGAIPSPLTGQYIFLDATCTIRAVGAAGSADCMVVLATANSSAAGVYMAATQNVTPAAIDTTAAAKLDMTVAWSTVAGGQTATFSQGSLQVLN